LRESSAEGKGPSMDLAQLLLPTAQLMADAARKAALPHFRSLTGAAENKAAEGYDEEEMKIEKRRSEKEKK